MYKQGDFVLTTSWWEGEEVRNDLPNVALVTGHKAGKLTLRYFYRPHQTFRKATQTFAIGELLLTNKTSVVAPESITGTPNPLYGTLLTRVQADVPSCLLNPTWFTRSRGWMTVWSCFVEWHITPRPRGSQTMPFQRVRFGRPRISRLCLSRESFRLWSTLRTQPKTQSHR